MDQISGWRKRKNLTRAMLLRSHYLSNRIYKNYDALFDHCKTSWNRLDEATLASITHTAWITHEIQG